jgi:hypothetical protein
LRYIKNKLAVFNLNEKMSLGYIDLRWIDISQLSGSKIWSNKGLFSFIELKLFSGSLVE